MLEEAMLVFKIACKSVNWAVDSNQSCSYVSSVLDYESNSAFL